MLSRWALAMLPYLFRLTSYLSSWLLLILLTPSFLP